jgi:enamine deaminase RidA (YjgF/YER057c/UK114 family)
MNKYNIISAPNEGSFDQRLETLGKTLVQYIELEKKENRQLSYCKIFLSDIQNQYQLLLNSCVYQHITSCAHTIVEQPPLDGSKISILLKTSDETCHDIFDSLRLDDKEAIGKSSYLQTLILFDKYMKLAKKRNLDIRQHLIRTWIYVANIDVNYEGVVKARNDFFRQQGLTIDTHFIASTGIGGRSETRNACVAIDFLSVPNITLENQKFLKALEHLNPTHEYGVAFERGTQLKIGDKSRYFISGTASIDKHGDVLYLGDVKKQMERLLENIDALLKDGEACIKDTRYFIIYLRDISDKDVVETYMSEHYPGIPHIVLFAPVCRPQWLIEMECIAEK